MGNVSKAFQFEELPTVKKQMLALADSDNSAFFETFLSTSSIRQEDRLKTNIKQITYEDIKNYIIRFTILHLNDIFNSQQ